MTAVEASTRRAYPHPSGHRWWNAECSAAVRALRLVSRPHVSQEDRVGSQEGLSFDLGKTEIQHFSRSCKAGNPAIHLQTPSGQHTVSPPEKNQATRWLGIWFDR